MPETEEKLAPPYVPFRTLFNFIELLRKIGVPQRIDRSVWGSMCSGATGSYLMVTLRYLELIDDDGAPTDTLNRVVQSSDQGKAHFKAIVPKAYSGILHGIDPQRATLNQLQEQFRESGVTGSTVKKAVRFFLTICRFSGIALSPHLSGKIRESTMTRRRSPQRARRRTDNAESGEERSLPPTTPVPGVISENLLLRGLFEKLPKPGTVWPDADRENWVEAAKAVFRMEYRTKAQL